MTNYTPLTFLICLTPGAQDSFVLEGSSIQGLCRKEQEVGLLVCIQKRMAEVIALVHTQYTTIHNNIYIHIIYNYIYNIIYYL